MFERLVASTGRAPDARRLGVAVVSVAVHAGIVAAALGAEPVRPTRMAKPVIWDLGDAVPASRTPVEARSAAGAGSSGPATATGPSIPAPLVGRAVPDGLPDIDAPLDIGGTDDGLRAVLDGVMDGGPVGVGLGGSENPATSRVADEAPELLAMPDPAYPPAMKALGVEGWVVLELVVDSVGRADPASVALREASDSAFVSAARAAVLAARFAPGRRAGRPVAVRASQRIVFQVTTGPR